MTYVLSYAKLWLYQRVLNYSGNVSYEEAMTHQPHMVTWMVVSQ